MSVGGINSSYGALTLLASNSSELNAQITQVTEQVSTGLVSPTLSGLGSAARTVLDLRPQISATQATQNGINAATGMMGVAGTAMSQIGTIASNLQAQLATLSSQTPGAIDVIAAQARASLQQVASLLDTKDGDSYVFAGQDSSNPPVPDPDNITSSGFFTQISAAVGSLATAGASATESLTLATASSNTAGTSAFSSFLSQPAAALSAARQSVVTGPGTNQQIGMLASANPDVTVAGTGSTSTGSYVRDVMRVLATVGSLSGTQVSQSGFSQLVSDSAAQLGNAFSALNTEVGEQGNQQTALSNIGSQLSDTQVALTSQLSNAEDADAAAASIHLSTLQTQLQASYEMISTMRSLTLINYLS